MTTTADNACLSCSQKKRRCDRAIPACSTCRRLVRECHYATLQPALPTRISYHEVQRKLAHRVLPVIQRQNYAAQDTLTLSPDEKMTRACLACRDAKRRCDKQSSYPSCKRCTSLGLSCIYWNGPNTTFADAAVPYFVESLAVRPVNAGGNLVLPVPERKEMPMLMHSFIETLGLAPLPVDKGGLAFSLRTSWAAQALRDPCSFHATLFSASAHLDAFRGVSYNPVTTYHYTTAMRLIREKLALAGGMPDEIIIACIPTMVFFSSLRGDVKSSQIHKKGLIQLLRAKGGLAEHELDGFFSALIPVCVMAEAIVFDSDLDIPGVDIPPIPFIPPTQLLSRALERAAHQTGYYNLSHEAIQIFKDIQAVCIEPDEPLSTRTKDIWTERIHSRLTQTLHPIQPNRIDAACHVAALIFFYLLFDNNPGLDLIPSSHLQNLVHDLKTILLDTTKDSWIRISPEAITWICLVGAAASARASADRIWFTLRYGQAVGCIRSEGVSLYMDCWMLYSWLNWRRKEKTSVGESG